MSLPEFLNFPDIFDKMPAIMLRELLASSLGASRNGTLTYGYVDAMKLAGHSCSTVVGAYFIVRKRLAYLYGEELPERGDIEVYMRNGRVQGTTGVVTAIATPLTGAAPETGFSGIGPNHRFSRQGLLRFDTPVDGIMALRRCDSSCGVALDLDVASISPSPEMRTLLPKAASGETNESEQARFAALWQDRMTPRMLLEHVDDPDLVCVHRWQLDA
jgi:hypothetical protein